MTWKLHNCINYSCEWKHGLEPKTTATHLQPKNLHFTVAHTADGGLVYNGGHVCETLLLLAAIWATAQCQISGGITNGVNYNTFWCMGKFRHWPGVMTIPREVVRKSVRVMRCCYTWDSALCNKRNKELTGTQGFTFSLLTAWTRVTLKMVISLWQDIFFCDTIMICFWCHANSRKLLVKSTDNLDGAWFLGSVRQTGAEVPRSIAGWNRRLNLKDMFSVTNELSSR